MTHEINTLPENDGDILHVLDGWKVKQYFNLKAGRWYVTISKNSPLARLLKRHRMLRSHFVYMLGTDIWEIGDGYVVHHRDFDSRNDRYSNLQRLTSGEHDALHRAFAELHGQPATFKGRKHRSETIEKMREIARARGNNSIWDCPKTHHHEETKRLMSERACGSGNSMFRSDLDTAAINAFYERCRSLKETAAHFGCSVSAVRYRLDPARYEQKANPLSGRERKYRFDDAEMVAFYRKEGAKAAAAKYGCTEATIYYRVKASR